jgi:6-phosphogluconolactonase
MKSKGSVSTFETIESMAQTIYRQLAARINGLPDGSFYSMALSGGNTPALLFDKLVKMDKSSLPGIDWSKVLFFWGDERCVPPDHNDSNFLMAKTHLLDFIPVQEGQIFRVFGENNPSEEALRYGQLIRDTLPGMNGLPCFDLIWLGLGEDGHTASIFPDRLDLFQASTVCAAVKHPQSGQARVTLTGPVINNAREVVFMVTGSSKVRVLSSLLKEEPSVDGQKTEQPLVSGVFPASLVQPSHGTLSWYLDGAASSGL